MRNSLEQKKCEKKTPLYFAKLTFSEIELQKIIYFSLPFLYAFSLYLLARCSLTFDHLYPLASQR